MRIDTRLDECVAEGFTGGPEYNTEETPMDNRRTRRNVRWQYPLHRYSAQFMNLLPEAKDRILAAFHVCRGKAHSFRFKDWNDYQAINEPIVTVAGTKTPAKLLKTYAFGSEGMTRPIEAPVAGAVVRATVGGTVIAGTLDTQTGLFTPTANWPGAVAYWTGEFDVWVRFDADYNPFTIGSWQAHTADIVLVEDPL